ncbi:hypothetical protein DXX93_17560 [Thalassotalea euphylliae]|uniref:Uncharacterized protein n=1 Tax=Thalassotalea euphylliae TaxID=1655234 RepID=A0A3E0TUR6_9GAMM|nr:hypothetical protein [Thalassotalea euphylliae]REL28194.1 hypothetical protein DXX93_17560 [Thalassotalea euphylliae]
MSIVLHSPKNSHSLFAPNTVKNTTKNLEEVSAPSVTPPSEKQATKSLTSERYSRYISNIKPEEVKAKYEEIRHKAKESLEAANLTNKVLKPFDYLEATIDEIENAPIEVKIDRDEVNTAILYNSLGISFLDVKRVEVRMEILQLAKDDVTKSAESGLIRKDQADQLNQKIAEQMARLMEEKENLMAGKARDQSADEFLNQVTKQRTLNL